MAKHGAHGQEVIDVPEAEDDSGPREVSEAGISVCGPQRGVPLPHCLLVNEDNGGSDLAHEPSDGEGGEPDNGISEPDQGGLDTREEDLSKVNDVETDGLLRLDAGGTA